MFSIIALVSFLYVPPVPPPEEDRMAAAMVLWEARPIPDADLRASLRTAASYVSSEALYRAGLSKRRGYLNWHTALVERLERRASQTPQAYRLGATRCLATGLAYDLTANQLKDLKAFILTPSGGDFWRYFTSQRPLIECLQAELKKSVGEGMDAEIAAARPAR